VIINKIQHGAPIRIVLLKKLKWAMPTLLMCSMVFFTGCSNTGTTEKFIPSEIQAREALEAALQAWVDGKRPGEIEGAPMPVQAADSQWQAGKKLVAFQIVDQEPNEGPPLFSVCLTMQGNGQPMVVRYYVVGKDPLWVYREDDYKASKGM
jgi:hypothetical protein